MLRSSWYGAGTVTENVMFVVVNELIGPFAGSMKP